MVSLRAFRQNRKAVLDEILRSGIIASQAIAGDLVHFVFIHTPSQHRYLARQEQ